MEKGESGLWLSSVLRDGPVVLTDENPLCSSVLQRHSVVGIKCVGSTASVRMCWPGLMEALSTSTGLLVSKFCKFWDGIVDYVLYDSHYWWLEAVPYKTARTFPLRCEAIVVVITP